MTTDLQRRKFGNENSFKRSRKIALYKLGTEKRPAILQVASEAREAEVQAICDKNGWQCEITVVADAPEELADLEELQNPPQAVTVERSLKRNDPCHCGSGKKYKNCHGKK